MKKIPFILLAIFAVLLSFYVFDGSVLAEENFQLKIETNAIHTTNGENNIVVKYEDNDIVELNANLYQNNTICDLPLTYVWKVGNKTVCETKTLTLTKNLLDGANNVLEVGEKKYNISISGQGVQESVNFSLKVETSSTELILVSVPNNLEKNTNGNYIITAQTPNMELNSHISLVTKPTSVKSTNGAETTGYNWYLKTPKSNSYNLISNLQTAMLSPQKLVGNEYGYGIYKVYCCFQATSGILYISKTLIFEATAGTPVSDVSSYNITQKKVNNSKAEVEAYKFELTNNEKMDLDGNKIYWLVDNVVIGKGQSIIYEPTSTSSFVLKAVYNGDVNNLTLGSEITVSPQSTATLKMILIISGIVCFLGIIFFTSVRILNKKRDVVW